MSEVISDASGADIERLADLASNAVRSGEELDVVDAVRDGAVRLESALLWQWTALIQRALDRHEEALESFANAARLAPGDALTRRQGGRAGSQPL